MPERRPVEHALSVYHSLRLRPRPVRRPVICCLALHQYDAALEHYRQAREGYRRHGLPVYIARCDTYQSDVYVATGRFEEAQACLERARAALKPPASRITWRPVSEDWPACTPGSAKLSQH